MSIEPLNDEYSDVDWTIGKYWTIFQNSKIEQRFREYKLTADATLVAVVCIAMVVLMVMGTALDINAFSGSLLQQLLIARLLAITFCFSLAGVVYFRPSIAKVNYFPLALMTAVILAYSFAVNQYVQASFSSNNLQIYPVFVLISFLIVAAPLHVALINTAVVTSTALSLHLFILSSTEADILNLLVGCTVMSILGFVFARSMHRFRRIEFKGHYQLENEIAQRRLANEQLRTYQEELEETVQKRTEQLRKSEKSLAAAQRMETIGQLAGGIAHDFNNLLTIILSYTELSTIQDDIEVLRDYQEKVRNAAERGAEMTKQLLAFSRRQIIDLAPVNIQELITDVRELIRPIVPSNIEVEINLVDLEFYVLTDYGQLEQVLMNLIINARDAMPGGGVLTLSVTKEQLNESFVQDHSWARIGEFVVIQIEDTGHGIEENLLDRIFEPFFTTKTEGQGTGLGLAMVFGTIKQMQGFLDVQSTVGEGTEFRLYLPVLTQPVKTQDQIVEKLSLKGTETILIIEDEAEIRKLGLVILQEAGYKVITAEDGIEGLEVYAQQKDNIDLLLVDVVMPRMGGQLVLESIREKGDDVLVLFTSGYSGKAIHTNFILNEGLELILKPYGPEELQRKVREVLDYGKRSSKTRS